MLNIQTIPVDRLQPAPYNPRVPLKPGSAGYRKLERSLKEFSLVQPIVWNEQTGHVVSGHQRIEILKNNGALEVEVAVVSLSLEREKALNVTLNNSQVGSDWDTGKLIDLVGQLNELPEFDATLTGFDDAQIRELVLAPEPDLDLQPTSTSVAAPLVRIHIDLPPERWESLRPEIDRFIAAHNLKVHITLPT